MTEILTLEKQRSSQSPCSRQIESYQPGDALSHPMSLVTRHPKKNGRKRDPRELLENPHAFIMQVLREELERFIERRGWSFSADEVHIGPVYDPPGVFRVQPKLWAAGATGPNLRPIQFKRFRQKRSDDGGRRLAGVFRIRFPEPVLGPIALGHSSHFGLGLFLPAAGGEPSGGRSSSDSDDR